MLKLLKLQVICLFMAELACAQQITPSVWMSSGNVGTMSNGNQYSWSMGESFTATLPSSTLTFTQGFQQLFNVLGCTDPTAFNYNASANQDDGSCIPMLTCNITAPTTTLCAGESVTLSMNTTGGGTGLNALPANLQQGLVAYYPFNGNANDASGNGNNGTVNGATLTTDRFGNANGAYQSQRDIFRNIQVPNQNIPTDFTNFSVSLWVKLNSYNDPGQAGFNHFINKVDGVNYHFVFSSNTTGLYFYYGSSFFQTTYLPTLNEWHQIGVSYDYGNINLCRFYMDGQLIQEFTTTSPLYINSGNVSIGSFDGANYDNVDGSFDEIALYNRALSPSEIQQLYTGQFYNWSNGATTSTNTVSPTASTTYSCSVTQGAQTCTASVDVTVNPAVTSTVNASIIQGQSYTLGTQNLTTAGTYTEVFTSAAGCDSTVTLNLTVEPLLTCNITAPSTTLCAGESVTLSMNTTGGGTGLNALPANLQQGLVAYYPFNGNANDASGNGNNGTVNGATLTSDRFGNANGAYSFDGVDDYISMNGISLPYGNSDRTISCFYQKLNNSSPWSHTIVSYGSPITSRAVMLAVGNNNYLAIQGWADDIGIPVASTNAWEHFVFSLEGGIGKAYVNGNLVATQNVSNWNTEYLSFIIGCRVDLLNSFLFGLVDDCMVYNRALSPSEIQQLYTAQSFNWSNGATTSTNTVSPTASTTYSCTVTQGAQTCTASLDVTVNPVVSNNVNASIIQGQSYTLGTQNLTTAGTYTEVFTSAAGCDSTVTLNLNVEPLLTCNITAPTTTLCAGESVTLSMNTTGGTVNSQYPPNIPGYNNPILWQGHYYYFSNQMINWNTASADALDNGGNLVIMENDLEKNFILSQMSGAVWTGLSQITNSTLYSEPLGGWFWNNGLPFNPSWWDGIQPDECSTCCSPIEPQNFGAFAGNGYFDDLCPSYPIYSVIEWVPNQTNVSGYAWTNGTSQQYSAFSPSASGYIVGTVFSGLQVCSDSLYITVNPLISFYADTDGDGFGNASASQQACVQPTGFVSNNNDCNDASNLISPSASEICNATDDNCNGQVDEGLSVQNYFLDTDHDGYGAGSAIPNCANMGAGYVLVSGDCNNNVAAIHPTAIEICGNNIDEDCSGADLSCTSTGAVSNPIPSLNIGQYGTGVQNSNTINLATGVDDMESAGSGLSKWFHFTALSNAVRIGLKGSLTVLDDNRLMLYNNTNTMGSQWIPLDIENVVTPSSLGTSTDGGNEVLLYDQLTIGNVYYVCVQNMNNLPGQVQLSIGFLYGSQQDIGPYTNNTNIYNNSCQNFKAKFRPNGKQYTIQRRASATEPISTTPLWTYSIPTLGSSVCQVGKWVAPNFLSTNVPVYNTVDVMYQLPNAFGTIESLHAQGTIMGTFYLAPELPLVVRTTDACPAIKNPTSGSVATNRSVCGVDRYRWRWTMQDPFVSLPVEITGPVGGSRILTLPSVPGMGVGQRYDVAIGTRFLDGVTLTPYGVESCVKTVAPAGMVLNHPGSTGAEPPLLSLRAGGEKASYLLYPNPTSAGHVTLVFNGTSEEEVKEIVMTDITGKIVYKTQVVLNGNAVEIEFGKLASGVYVVMVGEERMRLAVE